METPKTPVPKRNGAVRAVAALRRYATWLFGVLVLGALVAVVLHLGELKNYSRLLRSAEPGWLALAVAFQAGTYACAAGTWAVALRSAGQRIRYGGLVPLSIAKLFSDQAVPTGGLSGAMLVIGGLRRRGIETPIAMAVMLVTLVAYYAAYVAAAGGGIGVLWIYHEAGLTLWLLTGAFLIVASVLTGAAIWFFRRGAAPPARLLARFPALADLARFMSEVCTDLLRRRRLMAHAFLLQFAVFALDAATLWAVFLSLGLDVPYLVAFAAFVTGSIVATLGPVPLGLGTFEAATVAMLTALGQNVEAALTATLLLRLFTFWLPMVPGMVLARREMPGAVAA